MYKIHTDLIPVEVCTQEKHTHEPKQVLASNQHIETCSHRLKLFYTAYNNYTNLKKN